MIHGEQGWIASGDPASARYRGDKLRYLADLGLGLASCIHYRTRPHTSTKNVELYDHRLCIELSYSSSAKFLSSTLVQKWLLAMKALVISLWRSPQDMIILLPRYLIIPSAILRHWEWYQLTK